MKLGKQIILKQIDVTVANKVTVLIQRTIIEKCKFKIMYTFVYKCKLNNK
jgi:hypothetical protein